MKKILTGLTLMTILAAQAQELKTSIDRPASDYLENRFGAGLLVGEPTGVSLKYWLNADFAIDGGIGASFHRHDGLQLHSDILWHKFDLISCPNGRIAPYIGAGLRGKFEDGDDAFGFRFPIGISYILDNRPIDIFVEFAPIIDVTPSSRGSFNLATGARFWF